MVFTFVYVWFIITVNVSVNGLYICVCLEYLMTVGDFFTKGLPQAPAQPPPSTTKATTDTAVQPTEKPTAGMHATITINIIVCW